jgi:hypothetical protein
LKKCINILLAFLLFINSGGFIIVFYSQQLSVKEEIFNSIKDENYLPSEIICFNIKKDLLYEDINGFIWNDKKEFEYNGRMYDVIRVSEGSNESVLYCLNDQAEERILKSFSGEFNRLVTDNPKDSKTKTSLLNLIFQALFYNQFEFSPSLKEQKLSQTVSQTITKFYIEIPSPPPKHC